MKGIVCFLLLFSISSYAYTHKDIIRDYEAKKYKDVCLKSAYLYKKSERNEKILSIIGDACAKSDYINPLGYIVRRLVSTPQYRQNGSYFATLILQKKLIYQYMHDKIDLKNLRLPRTDHVLSIVFENLVQKKFHIRDGKIIINNNGVEYRVWLGKEKLKVVYIFEYKDGKLVKRHGFL